MRRFPVLTIAALLLVWPSLAAAAPCATGAILGAPAAQLLAQTAIDGEVNRAPIVTSEPPETATEGQPYAYDVKARDPDPGDLLTYSLQAAPPGMDIGAVSGLLRWVPAAGQAGSTDLTVLVTDSHGLSATHAVSIEVAEANAPPAITSAAPTTAIAGAAYTYAVRATDTNAGEALIYSLDLAPQGMRIDPAGGVIEWTPQRTQTGAHSTAVRVTDASGLSDAQAFTVNVVAPGAAPTVTSTPPLTATEGEVYLYDAQASGAGTAVPLNFSLDAAPTGMAIDAINGLIHWTPAPDQVGAHDIALRVSGAGGAVATQKFRLTVANVNSAPVITSEPRRTATEGRRYRSEVDAIDPDAGDTQSFSLTVAPAGMTIDPASGWLEWTPSSEQIGPHGVGVRVQDGNGGVASQAFIVAVAASNEPPRITALPPPTAKAGVLYNHAVEAADANASDKLTYSLEGASHGMRIDPATGLVQWTPARAQLGSHSVTVRVDDGNGGFTTGALTIRVAAANTAPSIVSIPPTQARVGVAYRYAVEASDANLGDRLAFGLDLAPAGMRVDARDGVLHWVPTAEQVGGIAVTVRVTDAGGLSGAQAFFVTVRPADAP